MFTIRYLKTITIILSLLLAPSSLTYAWSISTVGKVVIAEEYNDALRIWTDRRLGLQVSNRNDIFFIADTVLGKATTHFKYSNELKKRLEVSVLKAIKWSKIAKKNKADVRKVISCFGKYTKSCMHHGSRYRDLNHLIFEFVSQEGGKQTNLVITIIDRFKEYKKTILYLGPSEMNQLLGNIRKIEKGIEQANLMEEKGDLFN